MPTGTIVRTNNDPVEKLRNYKRIGSLKSSDGDCSNYVTVGPTHRDGETKNVRINHHAEGYVRSNRTENNTNVS